LGLFVRRLNEILIQFACDSVEPSPVFGNGLENDSIAMAANPDFVTLETKILWKPYRLGATRTRKLLLFP
jgi:hypothetical protein